MFAKIAFKKFYTRTVDGRAFLVTYGILIYCGKIHKKHKFVFM
jgi:hypothetical protein